MSATFRLDSFYGVTASLVCRRSCNSLTHPTHSHFVCQPGVMQCEGIVILEDAVRPRFWSHVIATGSRISLHWDDLQGWQGLCSLWERYRPTSHWKHTVQKMAVTQSLLSRRRRKGTQEVYGHSFRFLLVCSVYFAVEWDFAFHNVAGSVWRSQRTPRLLAKGWSCR